MEKKNFPMIVHGVQAIVLVQKASCLLGQKILLVQDFNDRGRGDNIRMYGVPGGGMEPLEKNPRRVMQRELFEEAALKIPLLFLKKVGCFQKIRPNGLMNDNHLFVVRLSHAPPCVTNDPTEVSKVHILELREVIQLALGGLVHEGSIRLIFHFLNGSNSGLLNESVKWQNFIF